MKRYLKPAQHSLIIMALCTILLLLNTVFPVNNLGIVPRNLNHLSGIVFAPFLHGGWLHLLSNFIPFVILSTLIGVHSLKRFWTVFILSVVLTGILVWCFARGGSIHVGMSGVVYAMWGYLIVYGFKRKHFRDIALAVVVIALYGGFIFGVLPTAPHISFESHLFGAIVGGGLGYYFAKREKVT